jgi:NAD(P)-dependent dehydrogenase (short-subunit alcohol dehydrogenase family)
MNSVTAIPSITAYNASKGGINNLTRNMALSLARNNIRVNAVAPGSVMTDMLRKVAHDREIMRNILSRTPIQRIADPKEIANVVKFLASPDASYITGQILYVDGGRSTLNYVNPVDEQVLDSLTCKESSV